MAVRLRGMDWGVLAYVAIASAIALSRMEVLPEVRWVLLAHALTLLLVILVNRPGLGRFGRGFSEIYPLVLVLIFYGALDILTGHGSIPTHEKTVQSWELAIFGSQVSREWWQRAPSKFWSTLFHAVYASYYLIVSVGPIWFLIRGEQRKLRRVVLAEGVTYAICFVTFLLFPVAGPNYEFSRPSAEFLDNPAARLVYALLERGSSYGAAFPSSHVAAALVAAFVAGMGSRRLGVILAVPSLLLVVAVVYCQMHYAMDSLIAVLLALLVIAAVLRFEQQATAATTA